MWRSARREWHWLIRGETGRSAVSTCEHRLHKEPSKVLVGQRTHPCPFADMHETSPYICTVSV